VGELERRRHRPTMKGGSRAWRLAVSRDVRHSDSSRHTVRRRRKRADAPPLLNESQRGGTFNVHLYPCGPRKRTAERKGPKSTDIVGCPHTTCQRGLRHRPPWPSQAHSGRCDRATGVCRTPQSAFVDCLIGCPERLTRAVRWQARCPTRPVTQREADGRFPRQACTVPRDLGAGHMGARRQPSRTRE